MLKYNRLFSNVKKWIENTPSIYVLKVWDDELLKVKYKVNYVNQNLKEPNKNYEVK